MIDAVDVSVDARLRLGDRRLFELRDIDGYARGFGRQGFVRVVEPVGEEDNAGQIQTATPSMQFVERFNQVCCRCRECRFIDGGILTFEATHTYERLFESTVKELKLN